LHAPGAPEAVEVAHMLRTKIHLQGAQDVLNRHPHARRLLPIDFNENLRPRGGGTTHPYVGQLLASLQSLAELFGPLPNLSELRTTEGKIDGVATPWKATGARQVADSSRHLRVLVETLADCLDHLMPAGLPLFGRA